MAKSFLKELEGIKCVSLKAISSWRLCESLKSYDKIPKSYKDIFEELKRRGHEPGGEGTKRYF